MWTTSSRRSGCTRLADFGRKGLENQPRNSRPAGLTEPPTSFEVTPHPWRALFGACFFGAAGLLFYVKLRDPRGLLINHLIELDPQSADIFWAILMVASLAMAALAILGFVRSFGEKVFLSLDHHAISGPRNWNSNRLVRITYSTIIDAKFMRMRDQEMIVISSRDGRKIKVGQVHFRRSTEWPQFLALLDARMNRR